MNTKTNAMLKTCKILEKNSLPECEWDTKFHLGPKTGWMNDPNGLCQFKGEYHIFFQYSPFDTKPGTNYWGHYTTKDFINYEYHKPALYVDENFDCHGVYSGSALVEDDEMTLFYTGNVKLCGENFDYVTAGREHNTISVSSKDGRIFDGKKLLMKNSDYPENCTCHVRDPKVWEEDGIFYMVLGSRTTDDVGEVLVFKSADKVKWEFCNRITTDEKFGFMWECPDLFKLDEKTFLAVSPQGVDADGYKYNNIYQSGYFNLQGDFKAECKPESFTEYDNGFDFYAPQTFVDEKGRRILIGWFGLPDLDGLYSNPTDKKCGRVHILTVPRELSLNSDGKLCQYPIKEIESLRQTNMSVECMGDKKISNLTVFDMNVDVKSEDAFKITIREDCFIDYADGIFSLSFGESGYGRDKRSTEIDEVKNLYILCDTSSVEIFVNDGEKVFSSRFYPESANRGVKLEGLNGTVRYSTLNGFNITEV